MIEKVLHTRKGITGLTTVAVLFVVSFAVADPLMAFAQSSPPNAAPNTCTLPDGTEGTLLHFDKIIFFPTLLLVNPDTANFPNISKFFTYDIKVTDDPNTVKHATQDVADFLNFLGYTTPGGFMISPFHIVVVDIDYETFCEYVPPA